MKILQKHHLIGISVFIIALLLAGLPVVLVYQLRRSNEINKLNLALQEANDKFQKSLSECYAVSNALNYIVEKYGFPDDFNSMGKALLRSHDVIAAVEIVEGGTIRQVYPLKGNEPVIGYDILKDSNRNKEAYKTIEKREMFFAGPFELKQGGNGVVGRMPIFRDSVFMGFSAVVMYFDTLLQRTGLKPSYDPELEFQLTKINPNTRKEEHLISGLNFDLAKEKYQVLNVTAGEWKIYVRPKQNVSLISLLPLSIFGFIIALVSGIFAAYLYRQPVVLRRLVDEKISKLNINEKMLELSQESAGIGSWAYNPDKDTVFMTEICRRIYGLEQTVPMNLDKMLKLCSPGYAHILDELIRDSVATMKSFDLELKIIQANAGELWVRITGCAFREKDDTIIYGATQDIDKLVKSENERRELLESIRDAFIACDENWHVTFFNPAAEEMFHISYKDIIGMNIFEMMNEKTRANIEGKFNAELFTRSSYAFEFYSEKLKIWCEVSVYKKTDGYSLYLKDVTVKHDYIKHIEHQNSVMKEIAWMQSHVVRAPLARIMGSVELLKAETDEGGRAYLTEVIRNSSRELDKIVNEITVKTEEVKK